MAIDTEAKRRSVMRRWGAPTSILPDGTIGAADRQAAAGEYNGIGVAEPEAETTAVYGLSASVTEYGLSASATQYGLSASVTEYGLQVDYP